jgi:hypothetical protein
VTQAAAIVDQNELSSLRIEQSQLIALLKNKADSWRTKLVRLAEIFERRYELADPEFDNDNFSISRISTEITHVLRRHNVAIADHVSDYLPDKYKNPNLARDFLNTKGPASWGGIDPSLLIDEISHLPAEEIKKLPTNVKILLYDTIRKQKNLIETDALEQHYQLNDKEQRDPIRTSRPFPPRVTKYSEAIHKHADLLLEWEQKVINDCPPPPELEQEFADGEVASYQYLLNFINEKYSLGMGEWLERDIYRIHQSKHGAAVKDKVETLLCKHCSILNREKYEPGDFVEMEWSWSSPTHWKCPECGGSEHVLRGLTREQCGDKALQSCPQCHYHFNWEQGISPMETQAVNLVNNLMGHYNSLNYYNTLFQKCTATRRIKLGVDLSSKA